MRMREKFSCLDSNRPGQWARGPLTGGPHWWPGDHGCCAVSWGSKEKRGQETAVLRAAREQVLVQPAVPGSSSAQQVQLGHLGWDTPPAVPCSSSHCVACPRGRRAVPPLLLLSKVCDSLQRCRACAAPKRWHLGLKCPKCTS